MARRQEEGLRPGGAAAAVGVAGLVAAADVGLRLREAESQELPVQAAAEVLAKELPAHRQGVAGKEIPGKPCHSTTSVLYYYFPLPEEGGYHSIIFPKRRQEQ